MVMYLHKKVLSVNLNFSVYVSARVSNVFFLVPKCQDLCQVKNISSEFYCAILFKKKSAAEPYEILFETYDVYALSETIFRGWFQLIKNIDFDFKDKKLFSSVFDGISRV
ncbi:hypothetical protein NPIL_298111 [Nephila pilipes]|uniref:Uncharacterized protein n=1 Tax=Nephila pilipes TaxID=299642 RepID=A0A8X6PLV3_NEPPI|nr:hypothetical protein NPIL_298111 [Nephila pilipes]